MNSVFVSLFCTALFSMFLLNGIHRVETAAFTLHNSNDKWSSALNVDQPLAHHIVQRNKRALFGGPSGDSGLEFCKIFKNKIALAAVEDVCQRCVEMFPTPDLHKQCRSKCFDNEIFEECARVVLREELISERQLYL